MFDQILGHSNVKTPIGSPLVQIAVITRCHYYYLRVPRTLSLSSLLILHPVEIIPPFLKLFMLKNKKK